MKKLIYFLATFLLICIFLSSCLNSAQNTEVAGDFKVELLFTHNGCNV